MARSRLLAAVAAMFLVACTSTVNSSNNTPVPPSPSLLPASPSATPAGTPSGSPSSSPSASASPSAAPSPTKLIISALSYHLGEVSIGYAPVTANGAGGTPPYRWSIGGGALPPGLTLSSTGTISGTPTAAGNYTFVILLQDSGGQAAGVSRQVPVVPYLTASGKCTKVCNVQLGCATVCGAYTDLAGGVQPFQYQLTTGTLPNGTALNGSALGGTFLECDCGYPLPYSFTVTITDAFGAKATVNSNFTVYQHVFLSSGTCYGNFGTGCTGTLQVFGGTPGSTTTVTLVSEAQNPNPNPANNNPGQCWVLTDTAPPAGFGLTDSTGVVTITIPSGISNGYGAIWTLTVTSSDLCGPNAQCTSAGANATIGVQCG